MVSLKKELETGNHLITFTPDDIKKVKCAVCKGSFEQEQEAYACTHCKKIFHKECVITEYDNIKNWPCHHPLRECTYFCGKITILAK